MKTIYEMSDISEPFRKSVITVKYKGKYYTGVARCHEDDNWSNYFGGRIAEARAHIKALKDKLKERTMEFKAIENFVKSVESYKTFDKESDIAKSMYKQMNVRKKELIKLRTDIEKLEDYIKANIEVMDKFSLKMKKDKKE